MLEAGPAIISLNLISFSPGSLIYIELHFLTLTFIDFWQTIKDARFYLKVCQVFHFIIR